MLRLICLALLFLFVLTGCIPRTMTEIPAFSGTIIDSSNGMPLAGVTIEETADHPPKGWNPVTTVTKSDGGFSYPAVTGSTVYQLPVPGPGWPISRTLTFRKEGYRDMTCMAAELSLFGKDNQATIAMLAANHSEPPAGEPSLIRVNDGVFCQVFVGSRVEYAGAVYLVGEIYEQVEPGYSRQLFSLWPIPPNEGEVVMDVEGDQIRLMPQTR